MSGGPDSSGTADVRRQIVEILPRLRRFCITLTRAADAADDLLQSTVERALARIDQWQPGTRLDSWMYTIARNLNIDQARARKTRGVSVDIDDQPALSGGDVREVVEARSDLAAVRAAILALPEDQRLLINLVIVEGQSYKEAAETLGIPIGTVMSRLSRARRAIDASIHGGDT